MPSLVLSPADDYALPPAPAPARLDRAAWDGVMASIGGRLRTLEAIGTGIAAIQEQLQTLGLQILDAAINPLIADTQAQLATLQAAVANTIAQNAAIIADFQASTTAALEQLDADIAAAIADLNSQIGTAVADLNAQVAAVQAQVDAILAGGIDAANVNESATRVFLTPEQRDEIGSLRSDLNDLANSLTEAMSAARAGSGRVVTVSGNVVAGDVVRVKTAGGVCTMTLPAAPNEGNRIEVRRDGANAVVIARNGNTITGLADDLQMNTDKTVALLTYSDGTWTVEKGRWS